MFVPLPLPVCIAIASLHPSSSNNLRVAWPWNNILISPGDRKTRPFREHESTRVCYSRFKVANGRACVFLMLVFELTTLMTELLDSPILSAVVSRLISISPKRSRYVPPSLPLCRLYSEKICIINCAGFTFMRYSLLNGSRRTTGKGSFFVAARSSTIGIYDQMRSSKCPAPSFRDRAVSVVSTCLILVASSWTSSVLG